MAIFSRRLRRFPAHLQGVSMNPFDASMPDDLLPIFTYQPRDTKFRAKGYVESKSQAQAIFLQLINLSHWDQR